MQPDVDQIQIVCDPVHFAGAIKPEGKDDV